MRLPRDIGPIHFVGIGGIGMSGIAEVLVNLDYKVTGSDVAESANVRRLREKGIAIAIGHEAGNVDGAAVVVVSSAIKRDNPELVTARAKRLPVVRRAEMLAELMRLKSCVAIAGTHGKTTTTSMVAALLDAGGLDPTVINGGIINAYGTNARLGAGDWMVVEADESDGTFLKLPADIAIVTNVDPEHLDHFKTFDAVKAAFQAFVESVPFYGFAVMCTDHPVVQALVGRIEDRRIMTYGENPQADARLAGLSHDNGGSRFSVTLRAREGEAEQVIGDLVLPMPGRHNALNATAAVAVAHAQGARVLRRREAALHPHRRMERRGGDRRLRPSSGGDRRRAESGARIHQRQGDRGDAAASLHPPAAIVRGVLHLLQRCRRGDRRRRLSGRGSADRGRRSRSSGRRHARARASQRHRAGKLREARLAGQRHGAAGRSRGVSGRRQHHAMGLCAARRTEGAGVREGGIVLP
jgi:UDP-N-acetylmuramate--L-alanine ligase